jgi:hypothetical protein
MSLLYAGDIVYCEGSTISRYVVSRVTPKYAFIGTTKLHREISSDGYIRQCNSNIWNRAFYRVASPELDKKYTRYLKQTKSHNILIRISNNWEELDDMHLDKLHDFLNEFSEELKGN